MSVKVGDTFTSKGWSDEVASGMIDYYFVTSITKTASEFLLLPVAPVVQLAFLPDFLFAPLFAGATGAFYKYVAKRKDPIFTPEVLSGKTRYEKNGAVVYALVTNTVTGLLPVPFLNPLSTMVSMNVGKNNSPFPRKIKYKV